MVASSTRVFQWPFPVQVRPIRIPTFFLCSSYKDITMQPSSVGSSAARRPPHRHLGATIHRLCSTRLPASCSRPLVPHAHPSRRRQRRASSAGGRGRGDAGGDATAAGRGQNNDDLSLDVDRGQLQQGLGEEGNTMQQGPAPPVDIEASSLLNNLNTPTLHDLETAEAVRKGATPPSGSKAASMDAQLEPGEKACMIMLDPTSCGSRWSLLDA